MKKLLVLFLLPLAAFGQGAVRRVDTLTQLLSLPVNAVSTSGKITYEVGGYTTVGDGGGGVFYWDPSSTAATNLGLVFKLSSSANGRWFRQDWDGDVRAFGAKAGTTNTAAIQQALDSATTRIVVPRGTFSVTSLTIPAGVTLELLEGASIKASVYPTTNASFIIMESGSRLIGPGTIDGNRAGLAASRGTPTSFSDTAKFFGVRVTDAANVEIEGVTIANTFDEALWIHNSTDTLVRNVTFSGGATGAKWTHNLRPVGENIVVKDGVFDLVAIYQHGLYIKANTNATFRNVTVQNMRGAPSGFNSTQLSAVIIGGDHQGTYSGFLVTGIASGNTLIPTPFAVDGAYKSSFSDFQSHGWGGGPQFEVNSVHDSSFSDVLLDGSVMPDGGTTFTTLGMFVRDDSSGGRMGPEYEDVQWRDRSFSRGNTFHNITAIQTRTGLEVGGSQNTFVGCRFAGNDVTGIKIQAIRAGLASGQFDSPQEVHLAGNTFINCVSENNSSGMLMWGSDGSRFIGCVFRNNSQGNTISSGVANTYYSQTAAVSGTSNSVTVGSSTYTTDQRNRFAFLANSVSNALTTPLVILSNTATTLYVDGNFDWTPSTNDLVLVTDRWAGRTEFIDCDFSDTQDWTLEGAGSFDPTGVGSLSALTRVTVRQADRIGPGQYIKLVGIATGGSSSDVIVKVTGYDRAADNLVVQPVTLADGSALATASLNVPLVNLTGQVTTSVGEYEIGLGQYPTYPNFGWLTGTGTAFGRELDGHFFVKVGSEYQDVWQQLTDTSAAVRRAYSTQVTNATLQVVKFDVAGIPSQQYGYYFNRCPGAIDLFRPTISGNVVGPGNLFMSDDVRINWIDSLLTENITATNIVTHHLEVLRNDAQTMVTLDRPGFGEATLDRGAGLVRLLSPVGGGFLVQDTLATTNSKNARLGMEHYDNGEEDFYFLYGQSVSNANWVSIGGGTSLGNAANRVSIYGASNNTTTIGTELARFERGTLTNGTAWWLHEVGTTNPIAQVKLTTDGSKTLYLGSTPPALGGGTISVDETEVTNPNFGRGAGQDQNEVDFSAIGSEVYATLVSGNYTLDRLSYGLSGTFVGVGDRGGGSHAHEDLEIVAGTGISITWPSATQMSIAATGGGGGGTNGTTVTVDGGADLLSANFIDSTTINPSTSGGNVQWDVIADSLELSHLSASAESYLLDRANHTGTQLASTISDFDNAVWTFMSNSLTASNNISFGYDYGNLKLMISAAAAAGATNSFSVNGAQVIGPNITNKPNASLWSVSGSNITVALPDRDFGDLTVASGGTTMTIDNSAVTTAKIQDSAVASNKIAAGQITTDKLADLTVSTAKIADSAITSLKIANDTIISNDIASATITPDKLVNSGVTAGTYINPTVVVNNQGLITSATTGSGPVTKFVTVSSNQITGASLSDNTYHTLLGTVRSGGNYTNAADTLPAGTVIHVKAVGRIDSAYSDILGNYIRIGVGSYYVECELTDYESITWEDTVWTAEGWFTVVSPGNPATVIGNGYVDFNPADSGTGNSYFMYRARGTTSGSLNTTAANIISVDFKGDGVNPLSRISTTHVITIFY